MEQEIQEIVESHPVNVAPAPNDEAAAPAKSEAPHWLRFSLAVEFLLALIAVTVTWEEIGGQGHLDLMPWFLKLFVIVGFCWSFVRFSAALAQPGKWATRRTVRWLLALLAMVTIMGLTTYYYHLHEPADDDDNDESPGTSVRVPDRPPAGAHL